MFLFVFWDKGGLYTTRPKAKTHKSSPHSLGEEGSLGLWK
jgi:hypothetical protein